jgi:hypothetical protein
MIGKRPQAKLCEGSFASSRKARRRIEGSAKALLIPDVIGMFYIGKLRLEITPCIGGKMAHDKPLKVAREV